MSHLLCQWINSDLTLSKKVEPRQLDEDFRSGYLFAEVLHQYKLIDNLKAFQNYPTADIAIKNFILLEPVFRTIGVPITASSAFDVINGKSGCAARLLYQIKASLLNVSALNLDTALQKYKHNKPAASKTTTLTSKETLPKYILESTNKKAFAQKEHEFFADRLKAKFRRLPPLRQTITGSESAEVTLTKSSAPKSATPAVRAHRLHPAISDTPIAIPPKKQEEEKEESLTSRAAKLSKQQSEIQRFKQDAKAALAQQKKVKIVQELVKEVEQFDKQFARWEKPSKATIQHQPSQMTPSEIKELRRQIQEAALDTETHERHLKEKLPTWGLGKQQTEIYVDKIRAKREEDELSRKEREQRRRKILLDQQKAQQDYERSQREAILLEKLAKQSKQERRIAEQLVEARYEKEIIIQNRLLRDQQYAERRAKDYEESLQREAVLGEQLRLEYQRQAAMQTEQQTAVLQQRRQQQYEKHYKMCAEMTNEIVGVAMNMIHYLEVNDKKVPEKMVNQWKLLFVKGLPVDEQYHVPLDKETIVIATSPSISTEQPSHIGVNMITEAKPLLPEDNVISQGVQEIDEKEFLEYLEGRGTWPYASSTNIDEILKNEYLGKIVDALFKANAAPERRTYVGKLEPFPLKVILLGKPFSGKHTVAQTLGEHCGVKIITVQDIFQAAIQASEKKETALDEKGKQVATVRAQLGAKAQESLLQGKPVEESLTVSLVAEAIRSLNASIASDPQSKGWVLLDFPKTKTQAQALEKELSGYEDSKPAKLGNLKRGKESAGKDRNRSLIASAGAAQEQVAQPESIIDAIFLLDVDNNTAICRSAGRRLDPITGRVYHLEFNPPPTDVAGLVDRLVQLEDEAHSESQLHFQSTAFDEQQVGIQEWFTKFNNLHIINANQDVCSVLESVESVLKPIIERKNQESLTGTSEDSKPQTPAAAQTLAQEPVSIPATAPAAMPVNPAVASVTTADSQSRPGTSKSKPQTAASSVSTTVSAEQALKQFETTNAETLARIPMQVGPRGVTRELAQILTNRWVTIESAYTDGMKYVFRSLRREREAAVRYFYETKVHFKDFLLRPDKKQSLVDAFQKEYNLIEDDLRADNDAKAEFHQRAEDLREKLWNISDERKEEAENERVNIIENRWVEDHMAIVANLFLHAIQLEVDRYVGTKQLLLDYTKDINEIILDESISTPPRIPLIDLNTPLDGLFVDVLRVKHELPAFLMPINVTKKPNTANPASKKSSAHSKKPVEKPSADKPDFLSETFAVSISEHQFESDALYQQFNTSFGLAMSAIIDTDFSEQPAPAGKGDKKKTATETISENKEYNPENLQEAQKSLKLENTIQRHRLERLKAQAIQELKDFKSKAFEVYMKLDEWIGGKFTTEMEAIRDLVNFIKESIEVEQKLSHELILEGDHFFVNFDVLTVEPEPEPRSESPIEHRYADRFTVWQLLNLSLQFQSISPSGVMFAKEFKDALQRIASFSTYDWLPETFAKKALDTNNNITWVKQLDPYQTGYVNWTHFMLKQALILPIDINELRILKQHYTQLAQANEHGKLTLEQYMTVPLWFERVADIDSPGSTPSANVFNRVGKLKTALFFMFSVAEQGATLTYNGWLKEHDRPSKEGRLFDQDAFLRALCLDQDARSGLEKAFYVFGESNDGQVDEQEMMNIYRLNEQTTAETQRFDDEWALQGAFSKTTIHEAFVKLPEGQTKMDLQKWSDTVGSSSIYMMCQYYQC